MIQAELAGKLSETERLAVASRWEDVLTSSVFGLLRYLPPQVTVDYLSCATSALGAHLVVDGAEDVEFLFWPALPTWIREPDVVVDIRSFGAVQRRIVIEAKYLSGKSQGAAAAATSDTTAPGDQLADQLLAAWADHISRRTVALQPPAVVYLTGHYVLPDADIAESEAGFRARTADRKPEFYWLPWWRLGEVLRRFLAMTNDRAQRTVAADLLALLRLRGQETLADAWKAERPKLTAPWRLEGTGVAAWWATPIPDFIPTWTLRR